MTTHHTPPRRIIRNAAQCSRCGDVVESKHRHDFRACSCGGIFVDGGKSYLRRGTYPGAYYIEMSEYEPAPEAPR